MQWFAYCNISIDLLLYSELSLFFFFVDNKTKTTIVVFLSYLVPHRHIIMYFATHTAYSTFMFVIHVHQNRFWYEICIMFRHTKKNERQMQFGTELHTLLDLYAYSDYIFFSRNLHISSLALSLSFSLVKCIPCERVSMFVSISIWNQFYSQSFRNIWKFEYFSLFYGDDSIKMRPTTNQ